MGKAANNEIRRVRARFFGNLSAGAAIVGITMMLAPFFFQSMRELHLKAMVLTACPVILLLILSWSWNLKAMDIAAEIED
ncbi:hypothetical protein GWG65_20990 [Bradyrhizobium sp. CSA207]|uniref:hypothetical protein n=1 Tax=Bradyrhizobium sp. CSA207 TaxID=2698826 RepID=UPI0023AEEEAC|nr:hypothetical protein [Bradyrhizobium sp. CSA207]MDE5443878.1 hypothetical protein [Bradyrhizobium sp. CSA207]